MTMLAYLAGLVRRVRLGIACLVVPCRNPLIAAKQLASLDVFFNGRLDIGLGIGSPSTLKSREYVVLGVNRKLPAVSLIGSPEEIRRTVRAYVEAGVSHFEIKFIYPTLKRHSEMLQLFAKEILPDLR